MIIKICQSIVTTEKNKQMVVYNKGRTIFFTSKLTKPVAKILGSRPKAYFKAKLLANRISVLKEVEAQDW